jgi:hypothetical protein
MSRAELPEDERGYLAFYADEFHTYGTLAWAAMLSECRKYGLQLVLAHQFTDQLRDDVLAAVLGNVDTMLIFRCGIRDAEKLHGNFTRNNAPLAVPELAEQQPFHAFLKRGLEHYRVETAPPFASRHRYQANLQSSQRRFAPSRA